MNFETANRRAAIAKEIVLRIKPHAVFKKSHNATGSSFLNGYGLDDCHLICEELDQQFREAGDLESAKLVHEIPILVFTALSKEQIPEFITLWKEAGA